MVGSRISCARRSALVVRELMEAEISGEISAELGEIAPDVRLTHRNGYRSRPAGTRGGEIELLIPKKRSGSSSFPSFVEPRRRCEQVIVATLMARPRRCLGGPGPEPLCDPSLCVSGSDRASALLCGAQPQRRAAL